MKKIILFYLCVYLVSCSPGKNIIGTYSEECNATDGILAFILKPDSTFENKISFPALTVTGNWSRKGNKLFLFPLKYYEFNERNNYLDLGKTGSNKVDTFFIKGNKLYRQAKRQRRDKNCFLYKKTDIK